MARMWLNQKMLAAESRNGGGQTLAQNGVAIDQETTHVTSLLL